MATTYAEVSQEPSLITRALQEGLRQLGYDSLKLEQAAALESLLQGKNVFVSVPTGFGKSLIYQMLAFCFE